MSEQPTTPQKPRCPVPVHQWPKEAALAVHYEKRVYFRAVNDMPQGFIFIGGKRQEEEITYTRAEALASQMLPAPDRVGVWAICLKGSFYEIDYFDDFEEHSRPDFPNQKYIIGRCDWDINSVFHFYFMGTLPTAEGEVWHE